MKADTEEEARLYRIYEGPGIPSTAVLAVLAQRDDMRLIPGAFYSVIPRPDVERDDDWLSGEEWQNEIHPARFNGWNATGEMLWNLLGVDGSTNWPVLWVGEMIAVPIAAGHACVAIMRAIPCAGRRGVASLYRANIPGRAHVRPPFGALANRNWIAFESTGVTLTGKPGGITKQDPPFETSAAFPSVATRSTSSRVGHATPATLVTDGRSTG